MSDSQEMHRQRTAEHERSVKAEEHLMREWHAWNEMYKCARYSRDYVSSLGLIPLYACGWLSTCGLCGAEVDYSRVHLAKHFESHVDELFESFPFCTEHEWDQYCEDTEKLKPRPRKFQGHFVCGWPINNVKQDGRAYFCSSIFPTVEALREHHDFHIYVFGRHSRATRLDLVPSLPVVWHEVVPFDHSIEDWIVDESFPHSLVPPPAGPVPPPPPPSPAPSGRVVRENAPPPVETEVSDEERSVLVKGSAAHKSLIALPAGGRTLYRRHSWP